MPLTARNDAGTLMSVDPRQLECFIAVAEELNLGRAAARLHLAQPPLTRRIQRLERDVGVELFRRTPGGMELSEPGEVLLERAYRIVVLAQRAVERTRFAQAGEVGQLAIGYDDSAILETIPSLIGEFVDLHPGVTISFELAPKATQIPHLRDRLLHVGFGRYYTDVPGITRRRVAAEPLFVAVKNEATVGHRTALTVADLQGEPLIVYPTTRPGLADRVVDLCLQAGFSPTVSVEAEDVIACLAYVAIGVGTAVVPESATNTRPRGVTFVRLNDVEPSGLDCVYLAEDQTPAIRLFARFLDERATAP
jgi:DNA-binding transcriptional LysR family regulator